MFDLLHGVNYFPNTHPCSPHLTKLCTHAYVCEASPVGYWVLELSIIHTWVPGEKTQVSVTGCHEDIK
jgi:hypothetical protein